MVPEVWRSIRSPIEATGANLRQDMAHGRGVREDRREAGIPMAGGGANHRPELKDMRAPGQEEELLLHLKTINLSKPGVLVSCLWACAHLDGGRCGELPCGGAPQHGPRLFNAAAAGFITVMTAFAVVGQLLSGFSVTCFRSVSWQPYSGLRNE